MAMNDYSEAAFTEADAYAALGMEVPGQQPEAADPAAAGANEQGPADPDGAEQTTESNAAGEAAKADETGGQSGRQGAENAEKDADADRAPAAGGMSKAERAEQARLRRERETEARVQAAVRKAEAELKEKHEAELRRVFERAGMTDRYNGGKQITTIEEFDAWRAQADAERLNRQLKEGNLTAESFRQAVNESQPVREAAELVERLKAQETAQEQERSRQAFEEQVRRELEEIHGIDPGVSSLNDILALPTGAEFTRLVRDRGMSYIEAFKLANMDRMIQARTQAAAQGAAVQQSGKAHLRSVVRTGDVPMDVPRDVVAIYRELNPDMTLDEIRRDYAAYKEGQQR